MYQKAIQAMLAGQRDVLEAVRGGDLSAVRWHAIQTKDSGTCDKNYIHRLRLSYYLLFSHEHDRETVRLLFEEELKDRESNSFQGIGAALENLTFLLQKYNEDGRYDPLFQRAKNANFDCACGYDPHPVLEENLQNWPLEDCVRLAIDTHFYDTAGHLTALWQSTVRDWNENACRTLIYFNQNSGRLEENEAPYRRLISLARQDPPALARAYRNLFQLYLRCGHGGEALKTFYALQKEVDFQAISHCSVLNQLLEDAMDFICAFPQKARPVWRWARPYLDGAGPRNWHGNLYAKSIAAAKLLHDDLAEGLSHEYDDWRRAHRL